MNSYGSVALVSHSIYKLLRYMNWFSNDTDVVNEPSAVDDVDDVDVDDARRNQTDSNAEQS